MRAFYAAILLGIEAQEMQWDLQLHEIEMMMLDKPAAGNKTSAEKSDRKVSRRQAVDWYCKNYNTLNRCTLTSGHIVNVKGEDKEAAHCFSKCLEMKQGKQSPSHVSDACPYNRR